MPPTLTKSAPRGARTVEELVDALEQEIGYRHQEAVAAKAATQEDRRARIDMTVEISDLKHLEKVIKSLRAVDGVLGVERAGRPG